ncbi:MAG: release factor glutamine methyltransferase [Myxococcota bacterium]|jgi:release factor glutamine methyltransferase
MMPLVDVLKKTEAFFKKKGISSPRLDAELILGHVLKLERVELYLEFDRPLTPRELTDIRALVVRRGKREPVAWLLEKKGFWTLDLTVRPGVLVPRPDTETLIEAALSLIPEDEELFLVDVGCGSGAIGLALALDRKKLKVFATDLSTEALNCTRDNATALGVSDRVAVLKGSLLEPIPAERAIDIVVSNPPYIPTADIDGLAPEVSEHEPRLALDGGVDGLDVYRVLVPVAAERARLAVLVEVGAGQAEAVAAMFTAAGLVEVTCHKDLAGVERVVSGRVG